jgi:hypothetical protein
MREGESVGKDMIKTRTEEGSVFVVRTDGESMEVQGEDEARAGMEKEFLLPLGWIASLGRCTWRTWARSRLRRQLLQSLGRLCIVGLSKDLFCVIFCSGMGVGTIAGFGFISLTPLIFDLFRARRRSSFSRTRSSSLSLRASRGGQMLPAGWNFKARF